MCFPCRFVYSDLLICKWLIKRKAQCTCTLVLFLLLCELPFYVICRFCFYFVLIFLERFVHFAYKPCILLSKQWSPTSFLENDRRPLKTSGPLDRSARLSFAYLLARKFISSLDQFSVAVSSLPLTSSAYKLVGENM